MNPLAELLTQLEAAVHANDRTRAFELARKIQQRLVLESHDQAAIERRLRELLAVLDGPVALPHPKRVEVIDADDVERGFRRDEFREGVVYSVWFGTNRKPVGQGGFGAERHDRTTRGRVEVFVPEAHRFGETRTPFWKKLLRLDLRDDRLRVQRTEELEAAVFFEQIHQTMQDARAAGETPHALFFLHGFNVTFEEAAIRAAQMGVDLLVPGATAFFSWPSRGSATAYPVDEASIEASEQAITDFLVDFTANCGAEKVHVVAHSMGTRSPALSTKSRIRANGPPSPRLSRSNRLAAEPIWADRAGAKLRSRSIPRVTQP